MSRSVFLPRLLAPSVDACLRTFPVVVVTGARQTGKTTLVRDLLASRDRRFLTLDDLAVLDRAEREPDALVHGSGAMTLDEVQRVPDLLRAVKRAVDEDPSPGRFLLTGSANLLLMRTVSETLAGRAVYLRLGPLTEREKACRAGPPPWGDLLAAADADAAERILARGGHPAADWRAACVQGGLPPVLGLTAEARARWFDGYVATYLERDLQQLSTIAALADFRRLLAAAAARVGALVNRADLARDAALSRPTAHRYVNLLEVSFQLRLLPAYSANRGQRVVKSPKLYFGDTGLAAHLAGLHRPAEASGALLEHLVLAQVDAWRETVAPRPEVFFWRTAAGAEVDFVIEQGRRLLPIEVKSARQARPSDAKGLEAFLGAHARARFGLLAHDGPSTERLGARVLAVPIAALL